MVVNLLCVVCHASVDVWRVVCHASVDVWLRQGVSVCVLLPSYVTDASVGLVVPTLCRAARGFCNCALFMGPQVYGIAILLWL